MSASGHHRHAADKRFEVLSFCGPERMLLEEWNDRFQQLLTRADHVPIEVFAMVVVAVVNQHASDSKEHLQIAETLDAFGALGHREFMRHLIAGLVALSVGSIRLPDEAD